MKTEAIAVVLNTLAAVPKKSTCYFWQKVICVHVVEFRTFAVYSFFFQIKIFVAQMSRVLEMVGYSMSFIVLVFALATFCYFRYVANVSIVSVVHYNQISHE